MNVLDKFSMKNKVSIVTGAAQGLGKAMASALAQAGSDIVISEINMPLGQKTAKELEEKYGIKTSVIRCDVTLP
jgi:NAD(P)-dependent dehydrogenase (short-subunit alcohol dehydrogenase family)